MNKKDTWKLMAEKPKGMFCIQQWQHAQFSAWRIIEQMTESSRQRFIVVSTAGSALSESFATFKAAATAFTQQMQRYF